MIRGAASTGAEFFLDGLDQVQRQQTKTLRELSSGYRVQDASDAPAQAGQVVTLSTALAVTKNYQQNLTRVQAEAQGADQAIGSGISLIESARSLALQGGSSTLTDAERQGIAEQIGSIQDQLVSIANSRVEGRYIFGGDQDQSATYVSDTGSATGVTKASAQTATRVVTDPQGQPVFQGLTAAQVFDATGVSAFGALGDLRTALLANDPAAVGQALGSLESVSDFLNQQQAYYGTAEKRISNEQDRAADQLTNIQTQLSGIRDADIAQAATDLSRETVTQQAAIEAQAQIPRGSLFDYLG